MFLVAGAGGVQAAGKEKVLHSFTGYATGQDGSLPYGGVVRDDTGNLYGTTYNGGANDLGSVFNIAPSGKETILHSFAINKNNKNKPETNKKQNKLGNIYGTTRNGSAHIVGVLFKLT